MKRTRNTELILSHALTDRGDPRVAGLLTHSYSSQPLERDKNSTREKQEEGERADAAVFSPQ